MDQDIEPLYQQEEWVEDEFLRRRRNHYLAGIASITVLFTGLCVGILFMDETRSSTCSIVLIIISLVASIGLGLYSLSIWRCPTCETPLGRMSGLSEKYCPYCGEEL